MNAIEHVSWSNTLLCAVPTPAGQEIAKRFGFRLARTLVSADDGQTHLPDADLTGNEVNAAS